MHKRISVYHFQRSHKRFRHFPLTAAETGKRLRVHVRNGIIIAKTLGKESVHRFHNRLLVSLLFRKILPDYRFNFLYFFFQFPVKTHPVADALSIFARKAGIYGMIGGQTADIEAESRKDEMTEDCLMFIHVHKTAALIQSAMMIGAVLAGASGEEIERVEKCAASKSYPIAYLYPLPLIPGPLFLSGHQSIYQRFQKSVSFLKRRHASILYP